MTTVSNMMIWILYWNSSWNSQIKKLLKSSRTKVKEWPTPSFLNDRMSYFLRLKRNSEQKWRLTSFIKSKQRGKVTFRTSIFMNHFRVLLRWSVVHMWNQRLMWRGYSFVTLKVSLKAVNKINQNLQCCRYHCFENIPGLRPSTGKILWPRSLPPSSYTANLRTAKLGRTT